MSHGAQVFSFAEARHKRGLPVLQEIRVGDRVCRGDTVAEGTVLGFRGSGAPDDPVTALVMFGWSNLVIPVTQLRPARRFMPPEGAA